MNNRFLTLSLTLCSALLAASLSGCASLSWKKPTLPTLPSFSRAKAPADEELPQSQTVKLCLTTAAELTQKGHVREATLLYEKARNLDAQAADYPRLLAPLYALQDDFPRAHAEYRVALAAHPADADLLNDLGCLHDRQGNFVDAEIVLRQAIASSPNPDRARVNLGLALAHQGKYQESFDSFAAVVGPAAAHSNLGAIMARQGRTAEAKQALRTALSMNPELKPARSLLTHLGE